MQIRVIFYFLFNFALGFDCYYKVLHLIFNEGHLFQSINCLVDYYYAFDDV